MNNFTLSFELISFLKWLLEDKQERLLKLINEAVKNDYLKLESELMINQEVAHQIIRNFIESCEKNLKNALEKNDILDATLREQLTEISNHLNLAFFDDTAISNGFQQAKTQIEKFKIPEAAYTENQALFRTVLISKILANWQPTKTAAEG